MAVASVDEEGCQHGEVVIRYPGSEHRVTMIQAKLSEGSRPMLTITFLTQDELRGVMLGISEDVVSDKPLEERFGIHCAVDPDPTLDSPRR
jgi:hypothetical protein